MGKNETREDDSIQLAQGSVLDGDLPPRHAATLTQRATNMASSDSDDDVIATSLFLLTSIVHEKHKLNENGRRFIRYCASAH